MLPYRYELGDPFGPPNFILSSNTSSFQDIIFLVNHSVLKSPPPARTFPSLATFCPHITFPSRTFPSSRQITSSNTPFHKDNTLPQHHLNKCHSTQRKITMPTHPLAHNILLSLSIIKVKRLCSVFS